MKEWMDQAVIRIRDRGVGRRHLLKKLGSHLTWPARGGLSNFDFGAIFRQNRDFRTFWPTTRQWKNEIEIFKVHNDLGTQLLIFKK